MLASVVDGIAQNATMPVLLRLGCLLGIIQCRYVFRTSGEYAGTIDGDRVVHRTVNPARIASPTIAAPQVGLAVARAVHTATLGEEPPLFS